MDQPTKGELFFIEVLKCFKINSFKVMPCLEMLLIIQDKWYKYLLETKEFGLIKDIDGFDFFVCTTSKSGIVFKGDLKEEEKDQLCRFEELYEAFYNLDINKQGIILSRFFPET